MLIKLQVENENRQQQYKELLKAYTKEALANMTKADIRSRFPEPYASMYCQQFDNFKNVADFFEFAAKLRGDNIYKKVLAEEELGVHVKFWIAISYQRILLIIQLLFWWFEIWQGLQPQPQGA